MKFGALPTLQAVVRRGNFAAAAQELGLTPSAVSQQMRHLEEHFGQPLFDRSGRAVKPTALALEVVATVDGALAGLQSLRDRSRPQASGRLRLGAINSVQLSTLAAVLQHSTRRYPALEVMLEPENTSERLLESLSAGDIDVAIVVRPRAGMSRKFTSELLTEQPFVLLYPQGQAKPASLQTLMQSSPWVRYNAKLEGGRMASAFVRKLVPGLTPRYEVMSTDAVVSMVSAGLGFSVVPKPRQRMLDAYDVQVLSLDKQMPRRAIVFARRAADQDNRRIDALLACTREVYATAGGD